MKKHILIYMLCLLLSFSGLAEAAEPADSETGAQPETETAANEMEENSVSSADTSNEINKTTAIYPADAPAITSSAGIVMDLDSGEILYQKDAYSAYYPASITKVMTALIALEQGNLTDTITMSEDAVWGIDRDSSHIALDVGEQLSLNDALYGMLLESANEAAWAIAEHIGGSIDGFAQLMNQRAESLGCVNTHFVNPHGLHDDSHYTCAYDMALIGRAAYSIPEFRQMAGTQTYTIPPTNLKEARELWHNDGMLFSSNKFYYEYCTGGKTGYTDMAKGTLLTYAEKDDKRFICVVLNGVPSAETFYDTIRLLDFCFDNYEQVYPLADFSFGGENTEASSILSNYYAGLEHDMPALSVDSKYSFYFRTGINIEEIEKKFIYYDNPETNVVGTLQFFYQGQQLGETDIISENFIPKSIQASTDAASRQKTRQKYRRILIVLIIIIIVLLLILIRLRKMRRPRKRRRNTRYYPKKKPVQKKPMR